MIIVVTAGNQSPVPDVDNVLKYQITATERDGSFTDYNDRIVDSIRIQKIDSEEQPYGTNIPSIKLQLGLG